MRGRLAGRLKGDRGQLIVEFTGMVPIILVTVVLLWQMVLIGYTFTLAGAAADQAARAGAVDGGAACRKAGKDRLPGAWAENGDVECGGDDRVAKATVELRAPLLVPGFISLPVTIRATGGAAAEGND
ncbi:pilus assembly protein [Streptomyces sp. NPDC050504]|uniref:pilus assembly protein n=1 Tax=Streptomyces sp. NPDC050504 TaxID=3365618 RepID=UPI0037ABBE5B